MVDVEEAHSTASARNRRDRASAIVKLWTLPHHRADLRHAVGGLQRGHRVRRPYSTVRGGDEQTARALRAVSIGSASQAMKANAFRMLQAL